MLPCPLRLAWNTTRCPSGDQVGPPATVPSEVSWIALAPSRSEAQISHAPERSDANTTRRPSGESCGMASLLDEEMATTGRGAAGTAGREVSMRQILES